MNPDDAESLLRPISSEAHYRAVLREVSAYFDNEPSPGTKESDRFEALIDRVKAYEDEHYPFASEAPERMRMSPEMLVAAAIGSVRMEGLPLSEEWREVLRRVATGELTGAAARAQLQAQYGLPPEGPPAGT